MSAPTRIVSLISSATEMLYLIGLGERVVGVSHECDFPADIASKPRLTRSLVDSSASSHAIDDQVRTLSLAQTALYTIDVERLAALAPDVIVTQAQCDVCAVRYDDVVAAVRDAPALQDTKIISLNPHSLAEVLADIRRIGEATEATAAARAAVARLEARIAAVTRRTAALPASGIPRVACLEWIDPPMLAANWTPQLVQMAGGEAGLTVGGMHSTYADWQSIIAYDPQVVVVIPCGFDLPRAVLEAQVLPSFEGWSQLSAVRQGRVFAADGNAYFNRSGPRLVDSLEILAHLFHPESFAPPATSQHAFRRLETRAGALQEASPS